MDEKTLNDLFAKVRKLRESITELEDLLTDLSLYLRTHGRGLEEDDYLDKFELEAEDEELCDE